jgi:hypothetical protein
MRFLKSEIFDLKSAARWRRGIAIPPRNPLARRSPMRRPRIPIRNAAGIVVGPSGGIRVKADGGILICDPITSAKCGCTTAIPCFDPGRGVSSITMAMSISGSLICGDCYPGDGSKYIRFSGNYDGIFDLVLPYVSSIGGNGYGATNSFDIPSASFQFWTSSPCSGDPDSTDTVRMDINLSYSLATLGGASCFWNCFIRLQSASSGDGTCYLFSVGTNPVSGITDNGVVDFGSPLVLTGADPGCDAAEFHPFLAAANVADIQIARVA